ncbi:MAG TPA: hypothetical protein VEA80_19540 [Vitreimonas sp.]|nr:hypothetical protein [Vitreimonas sp.]
MTDEQPLRRVRMWLLVIYVVFGSLSLFGAMLMVWVLLFPEQGIVTLPAEIR